MDNLPHTPPEAIDTSSSSHVFDPFEVSQDKFTLAEHEKMALIHANTVSDYAARVLEIFPDVEPDHATALVTDTIEIYGTGTVERVLHTLFDDPRYPKVQKRGNRNLDDDSNSAEGGSPPEQVNCCLNYGDHNRPFVGGENYPELTRVCTSFISLSVLIYYVLWHRNILKTTSLLFR
jgi:TRIAD3 protein (E3 ubiquitin-protein ligase RNF216)